MPRGIPNKPRNTDMTASAKAHELDGDDENPFFKDEGGIFPEIPIKGFSIKWVRCSLRGEDDLENISAHMNDQRFQWSYVRPDEVSDAVAVNKRAFHDLGDVIRVRDCIAMKCPEKRTRQYREYLDHRSKEQINGLRQRTLNRMGSAVQNSPASFEEKVERGHSVAIDEE